MRKLKISLILLFALGVSLTLVFSSCKGKTSVPKNNLAVLDDPRSSVEDKAHAVFNQYNCNDCHSLAENKFGFTPKGEQLKQNSEGCVSMLTRMSVIVHVKDGERTPAQKETATHFNEYGCTTCHQVEPGKLSLTQVGSKLSGLHLSCVGVQKALANRRPQT